MSVILHIIAVICALFIVIMLVIIARALGMYIPRQGQEVLSSVLGWAKRHSILTIIILLLVLNWIFFPKGCSDEPSGEKSSDITTKIKTGKEARVVSPTAEDEPKGTIVGGPKKVVTNVSPDRINEWMLRSMTGGEGGWNLMRRKWTGSIDKQGYLPLPVGPLVTGAKVETRLSGRNLPATPAWKIINQNQDRFQRCGDQGVVNDDTHTLFLEVRAFGGIPSQPVIGRKTGFSGLLCTAAVTHLPDNVGMWIGSYSTCTAESLQKPGPAPFKIDGEQVSWTMRLTIIPSAPVAPGAQELKETISPIGFYDIQRPMLWLLPESTVIDESSPEATKASLDEGCVFKKELTPPFNKRESPTRDSFEVTSDEVRRAWQKEPGKEVEWALVNFKPPTNSLVYWEMYFPVE